MAGSTITKLANFYSGLTVFLFWGVLLLLILSFRILFNADYEQELYAGMAAIGGCAIGIIGIGAISVGLDIMNTNRDLVSQNKRILTAITELAQVNRESKRTV